MSSEGGVNLATAFVQLTTSAEGVGKEIVTGLDGTAKGAGDAGEKAGKSFGQRFTSFITSGKAIAAGAVVGSVVGAFKGLYSVGGVFDDVADSIRVGTGATGKDLDALTAVAKNVGTNVPVEFEKVGPVVADLNTRLGLTGSTLDTVAQQYLQAGHILGEDVDIKASTGAMSAFGIAGKDVSGALDKLFSVSQSTGVSMNELSKVVGVQAPTMKNLGFTYEQTVNMVGQLDKAGVNSNQVMASMSKGLATLAKSGKDPQAAFADVTSEIQKYVEAGDTAGAVNVASKIFGTRGAAQFVAAVQSGTLSVDSLMTTTISASDTILQAAGDTADFAESWTKFKNKALVAVEPVAARVFNALGNGMSFVADQFDPMMAAAKRGGATVVAALTPIAKSAMDTGKAIFDSVATAAAPGFKAVGDAIGPFVSALGSILPALSPVKFLFDAIKPLLPTIGQMLGQVASVLGGALASVLTSVTPLLTTIGDVVGRLASLLTPLIASLLPPLNGLFGQMAPLLNAVLGAILPIVDAIASALIPIINALMPVVETVFGAIGPLITDVMSVFSGLITFVTGVFSGDWSAAWDGIKQVFEGIWNGVKDFISGIWETIKTIFSTAWDLIQPIVMVPVNAIKDGITIAFNAVSSFLSSTWGSIKSAAQGAWNLVKSYIIDPLQTAYNWVMDTFGKIAGWFENLWNGIKDTASSIIGGIGNAISAAWNGVISTIKSIINGAIGIVNSAIDGINWVTGGISSAWTWAGVPGIPQIPHIPTLATGGVVEEPTIALIGDAGAGNPEIVAPQRMLREIIRGEVGSQSDLAAKIDELIEAIYAASDANASSTRDALREQVRQQRQDRRQGVMR